MHSDGIGEPHIGGQPVHSDGSISTTCVSRISSIMDHGAGFKIHGAGAGRAHGEHGRPGNDSPEDHSGSFLPQRAYQREANSTGPVEIRRTCDNDEKDKHMKILLCPRAA